VVGDTVRLFPVYLFIGRVEFHAKSLPAMLLMEDRVVHTIFIVMNYRVSIDQMLNSVLTAWTNPARIIHQDLNSKAVISVSMKK
jgi:hypothetical protein